MITNNLEKTTQKTVSGKTFNDLVDYCNSLIRDYNFAIEGYIKYLERDNKHDELLNKAREQYLGIANKYMDLYEEFEAYKSRMGMSTTTTLETEPTQLDRDTLIRLERYEEVAELDRMKGSLR